MILPESKTYRIALEFTNDPYTRLKPGDEGLVIHEPQPDSPWDTLWVKWDSGSTMGLVPGVDRWRRLEASHAG